jgi:hypothetical protein
MEESGSTQMFYHYGYLNIILNEVPIIFYGYGGLNKRPYSSLLTLESQLHFASCQRESSSTRPVSPETA